MIRNSKLSIALILLYFSIPHFARADQDTSDFTSKLHSAAGSPGCLSPAGGLDSVECQDFDSLLQAGRHLYAKDKKSFVSALTTCLNQMLPGEYSYFVVLVAAMSSEPDLLSALKELSEREKTSPTAIFKYARYAVEKITTGKCSVDAPPQVSEICSADDGIFQRIRSLSSVSKHQR